MLAEWKGVAQTMKPLTPNNAQYCAPIIDFTSFGLKNREELEKFFDGLPGHAYAKIGQRMFAIIEVPADPRSVKRAKPSRRKRIKNEPGLPSIKIRKAEIRKIFDAYYQFYETEYVSYIKKFDTYGAKNYAAEKTIEKIRIERQIPLSVRNVIVAMNLRMSK